jgi:hypothetical protein
VNRWLFRIVDVFTDRPLAGNQLAVFEDAAEIPESLLQPLAQEIGYSETVFAYPGTDDADARVRIFTPTSEIPFAGHPVLGTAVVLATRLGADRVVLETGRGPVPVRVDRASGAATRGAMEQPIPTFALYDNAEEFLRALGVERSVLPVTIYDNGLQNVYAMLESPDEVAALKPNFSALSELARSSGMSLVGFNVFSGSVSPGRRACLRRLTTLPKIRQPAPPPGHWRCIWPATGASRGTRRFESPRASRSAGQASSSPASPATRTASRASRSAATRSRSAEAGSTASYFAPWRLPDSDRRC